MSDTALEQSTVAGTADPSQSVDQNDPGTGTGRPADEAQLAAADYAAALKAFKSAMGTETASEAPAASETPAAPAKVEDKGSTVPASPEAPQAPQSPDLAALMARMVQFEDAGKASERRIAELQSQIAERDAKLKLADNPIEFLKQQGWDQKKVEAWLLGDANSAPAQESQIDILRRELEAIKAERAETKKEREARQAEEHRAAAERNYRDQIITPALDAAKYPLLHQVHDKNELVNLAYGAAVQHLQRTGQEPAIADVLASMEKGLGALQAKLGGKSAPVAKQVAPALSQLAAAGQSGTADAEPEDDAAAFRAAAALARQFAQQK